MKKLNVLLVVDYIPWILGTWAKQIVKNAVVHEYYLFSGSLIDHFPEQWSNLVERADIIHFLTPYETHKFPVPKDTVRINSIHHVVDWEKIKPLSDADAIMVVAQEWRSFLLEKGVPDDKINIINNGVAPDVFYPCDKTKAKQLLGCDDDSGAVIGFSAKLTSNRNDRKGVGTFIKALKAVKDRSSDVAVMITGPGWNKIVSELKAYDIRVYYYPFLVDELMPAFYNAIDMYVITSRIEGGPAPLLESMACRTPVVTTPIGLAIDYIQDGVNGLLIEKDSVEETAAAIEKLVESTERRHSLAEAGLSTVRENLTWDKTLSPVESVYTRVWEQNTVSGERCEPMPVPESSFTSSFKQRQWAADTDSYLWCIELCLRGYYREGFRGINALQANGAISKMTASRLAVSFVFSKVGARLQGDSAIANTARSAPSS